MESLRNDLGPGEVSMRPPEAYGRSFRAQGKSFQASKVINFGPQGDHLVVLRRSPGES